MSVEVKGQTELIFIPSPVLTANHLTATDAGLLHIVLRCFAKQVEWIKKLLNCFWRR